MLNKTILQKRIVSRAIPIISFLSIVTGTTILILYIPANSLLVLTGSLIGLIICWLIGRKSTLPIFVTVVMIGYFQGAIVLLFQPPFDIGIIKYGLLLISGIFLTMRIAVSKQSRISRTLLGYVLLAVLFYILFMWMLIRFPGEQDNYVYAITIWSVLNVPLAVVIYADLKSMIQVYRFLHLLVWLGIIAAAVGLAQYFIGYDNLLRLGLRLDWVNSTFATLDMDDRRLFRVFSVFANHYWFSSFMVISITAKVVLQLRTGQWPQTRFWVIFLLLLTGLLVTFNVTMWISLAGILVVMFWGWSGKGIQFLRYFLRYKKAWQVALGVLVLGLLIMVLLPDIRERAIGIFVLKDGTAAGSLFWRRRIFFFSMEFILESPWFGFGPGARAIFDYSKNQYQYLVTADILFTWLILMGGIHLFFSFSSLFFFSLWASFRQRAKIPSPDLPLFWAIWATLFVGVLLGSVSNGALIRSTPANLIIWASIGVLLKMLDWNRLFD